MVEQAFLQANIPFTIKNKTISDINPKNGWEIREVSGSFLLKHINTSFSKNLVCYSKRFHGLDFTVNANPSCCNGETKGYKFTISEITAFCFDTGTGIATLHIPYLHGVEDDELINVCAALRCSVDNVGDANSCAIYRNDQKTYLSCIAIEHLTSLLSDTFELFGQFTETNSKRVDMFSAALCDEQSLENDGIDADRMCYLIANTLDTRDKQFTPEGKTFYRQHDYRRWCFSKRGCCAVANLTGNSSNDTFLSTRWLDSLKTNYFYIYIMVLHQKYAIYNYLNTIASDSEMNYVAFNQESLIEFNAKYIFAIVSDESFIQNAYMNMRSVNNVDEVYTDLVDEQKRMFEYSQLKSNETNEIKASRLNIISIVISIICSLGMVVDTVDLFSSQGYFLGFNTSGNIMCTIAVIVEVLVFTVCLISVYLVSKNKKK